MKKIIMTAALGLLASSAAFAGGKVSYEDFIRSCKNPDEFGHQRPPEQIRVICESEETRWVPVESAPFELKTIENLTAELFSDKHNVEKEYYPQPDNETTGVCPRLREDIGDAVVEVSLSCAEVLNGKRGLESICLDAIRSAEASNPGIREWVPTGNMYEPCGEAAPPQQQQQQQHQEQRQGHYRF